MDNSQKQTKEQAQEFLRARQVAYRRVFNKEDETVKHVMDDLAKFCRASTSTYDRDEREHARMEGRREVWIRIASHLELDPVTFWELYTKTKY
jgi:hypothetical protein